MIDASYRSSGKSVVCQERDLQQAGAGGDSGGAQHGHPPLATMRLEMLNCVFTTSKLLQGYCSFHAHFAVPFVFRASGKARLTLPDVRKGAATRC